MTPIPNSLLHFPQFLIKKLRCVRLTAHPYMAILKVNWLSLAYDGVVLKDHTHLFGLRNRITHGYFDIDVEMIEEVIQNDLAPLLEATD